MYTSKELEKKFGHPESKETKGQIVMIPLPYPMKLAWDKSKIVNRMRCNKIAAEAFKSVFDDLLSEYGLDKIQELGIDLFGGCYNRRAMRGGTSWSSHSWGISVDLDPSRNKLRETKRTARFARPEYDKMIAIFEKHGFISLGKYKDYDWMHFQFNNF